MVRMPQGAKFVPFVVGPCGFYLGWLIYRNNLLRFSDAQIITIGERYARLISSIANHDPEWVEVPAEKYKETKLTFEVMHMEIDGMLKQLEVLHWWRNPPEVRNRVFVLEAELKSCKERLRYLKGEESELLKSCLTVDLPTSPIQPIKTTKRKCLSESTMREVGEQALKYLASKFELDPSVEIRIESGTGVGVEGKKAFVRIDPSETSVRSVLQACAQALYRNYHLSFYNDQDWPEFQVITRATPRAVMEHAVGRFLAEDIVQNIESVGIEAQPAGLIEAEGDFWENLDWNAYKTCEKNPNDLNGIVGVSGFIGNRILAEVPKDTLFKMPTTLSLQTKPSK